MPYETAWRQLWNGLGIRDPDPALLSALLARYSEPHRKYHTLEHLDACLGNFALVRDQATHPSEVELALWFHDAIYEIPARGNEHRAGPPPSKLAAHLSERRCPNEHRSGPPPSKLAAQLAERSCPNERQSADWASDALLGAGAAPEVAQRVQALVMVTCHDRLPQTGDEALLLDVDLAILGAPPVVFDVYEAQIGAEYNSVPEPVRRSRRQSILQGFLERERIFHSEYFRDRLEAQARTNLRRSIAALGSSA